LCAGRTCARPLDQIWIEALHALNLGTYNARPRGATPWRATLDPATPNGRPVRQPPWLPQLLCVALLKPPILLHGLYVLASITIVKVNVRQPVKINVSDKWHCPIAMRTLYIGRTLLCFGRFHLSQCSALPARRMPTKTVPARTTQPRAVGFTMTCPRPSVPFGRAPIIFCAKSRVAAANFRLKDLAYIFEGSRHFGYCLGIK
jgi:hypothetical protein